MVLFNAWLGLNTVPKNFCPKVNAVVWLKFDHAYKDASVQHANEFTTSSTPALKALRSMESFLYSHYSQVYFDLDREHLLELYLLVK